MAKIRKAVIPAAGLGTRFLPATKAVPKELLPIVDTPSIQYIVQEVVDADIHTVILISGRGKSSIVDHFDVSPELEEKLLREGKHELAERLRSARSMATIVSVRQGEPRGLGHAVLRAKDLVGNEPFVVLLGDDLVDADIPCTKQMADVYEKYGKSVCAVMEVPDEDVSRFGIISGEKIDADCVEIDQMVEKPALSEAPSNLAIVGRYILTPRIFELLEKTDPGKGGEIQLTDAMALLMKEEGFIGYKFKGDRYDAGDQFGYLQANIAYGLKRKNLAPRLLEYMKEMIKKHS
ncbi:MAG: UTP--glucose-1-phosphate uridylyltransferase [Candidatus Dadabacteria bacterium]|nr:MAG: UTP--glucose-1-phosphate uridylyltransferase [Candidatus Dadabacteria bacterium]